MNKSKKHILFVCPYPKGQAPSQRFRFEQYFNLLKEHNFEFSFSSFYSERGWEALYKKGNTGVKIWTIIKGFAKRKTLLLRLKKYDFIFIHREATPIGPPFFEWGAKFLWRKKIIYDFDDAIWLSDHDEKGSIKSILKWKSKIAKLCKWSYRVSCGNQFLSDFSKKYNENTVINPTTIDTDYHYPEDKKNDNKIRVGWTGTHSTLHYLEGIIEPLKKAYTERPFELLVIANKPPDFDFPELSYLPWSKDNEIKDLQGIDIGLMPLTDDLWSKGKCGFKALQYMALEKPVIASPVGVNSHIVPHGGILVHDYSEWVASITALLTDEDRRNTLGRAGRMYVKKHFSTQSNANNFLYLFSE